MATLLTTNPKVLQPLQNELRGRAFSSRLVLTDHPWERTSDLILRAPSYLVGIAAALFTTASAGMFVCQSGEVVDADYGNYPTFIQCPAGGRPDGYIELVAGTSLLVRMLDTNSDIAVSGAVVDTEYVVGTDGLVAKVGGTYYPNGVSKPCVIGRAVIAGRVMLGLSGLYSGADLASQITAYSTAVTAATRTDFDKKTTINGKKLRAGNRIITEILAKVVEANTETFVLYAKLGSVDFFQSIALDPVNAGDTLSGRLVVEVVTAGASGFILASGMVGVKGDVADKRISFGGLFDETAIDLNVAALDIQLAIAHSTAVGSSTILRKQRTWVE